MIESYLSSTGFNLYPMECLLKSALGPYYITNMNSRLQRALIKCRTIWLSRLWDVNPLTYKSNSLRIKILYLNKLTLTMRHVKKKTLTLQYFAGSMFPLFFKLMGLSDYFFSIYLIYCSFHPPQLT